MPSWVGTSNPVRVAGYHPKLDATLWPTIWNPDWDKRFEELYGYDPAKAKALLKEAGYPQGFEFTVYLYTLPGLPEHSGHWAGDRLGLASYRAQTQVGGN